MVAAGAVLSQIGALPLHRLAKTVDPNHRCVWPGLEDESGDEVKELWYQACKTAVSHNGAYFACARKGLVAIVHLGEGGEVVAITDAFGAQENVEALEWLPGAAATTGLRSRMAERSVLIIGTSQGNIRMYTESGVQIWTQVLYRAPVLAFKVRTLASGYRRMPERTEELLVVYSDMLARIDGSFLHGFLRNGLAMVDRGEAVECPLEYRLWQLSGQERTTDVICCGLYQASMFDAERTCSSYKIIAAGDGPMLSYYEAGKEDGEMSTAALVGTVATKVASSMFGLASGLAKNIMSRADANPQARTSTGNPGEAQPKQKSVKMDHIFENSDGSRTLTRIQLDPTGSLAACTDTLGRVLVVDIVDGFVMNIFKGYRDAQCCFLQAPVPMPMKDSANPVGAGIRTRKSQQEQDRLLSTFLVIYAPRRGLVEVWKMRRGGRVLAFNIGSECIMMPSNLPFGSPVPVPHMQKIVFMRKNGDLFAVKDAVITQHHIASQSAQANFDDVSVRRFNAIVKLMRLEDEEEGEAEEADPGADQSDQSVDTGSVPTNDKAAQKRADQGQDQLIELLSSMKSANSIQRCLDRLPPWISQDLLESCTKAGLDAIASAKKAADNNPSPNIVQNSSLDELRRVLDERLKLVGAYADIVEASRALDRGQEDETNDLVWEMGARLEQMMGLGARLNDPGAAATARATGTPRALNRSNSLVEDGPSPPRHATSAWESGPSPLARGHSALGNSSAPSASTKAIESMTPTLFLRMFTINGSEVKVRSDMEPSDRTVLVQALFKGLLQCSTGSVEELANAIKRLPVAVVDLFSLFLDWYFAEPLRSVLEVGPAKLKRWFSKWMPNNDIEALLYRRTMSSIQVGHASVLISIVADTCIKDGNPSYLPLTISESKWRAHMQVLEDILHIWSVVPHQSTSSLSPHLIDMMPTLSQAIAAHIVDGTSTWTWPALIKKSNVTDVTVEEGGWISETRTRPRSPQGGAKESDPMERLQARFGDRVSPDQLAAHCAWELMARCEADGNVALYKQAMSWLGMVQNGDLQGGMALCAWGQFTRRKLVTLLHNKPARHRVVDQVMGLVHGDMKVWVDTSRMHLRVIAKALSTKTDEDSAGGPSLKDSKDFTLSRAVEAVRGLRFDGGSTGSVMAILNILHGIFSFDIRFAEPLDYFADGSELLDVMAAARSSAFPELEEIDPDDDKNKDTPPELANLRSKLAVRMMQFDQACAFELAEEWGLGRDVLRREHIRWLYENDKDYLAEEILRNVEDSHSVGVAMMTVGRRRLAIILRRLQNSTAGMLFLSAHSADLVQWVCSVSKAKDSMVPPPIESTANLLSRSVTLLRSDSREYQHASKMSTLAKKIVEQRAEVNM